MGSEPQWALNPNAAPQCSPTPKPPHPTSTQWGPHSDTAGTQMGVHPRIGAHPAPKRGSHGSTPPPQIPSAPKWGPSPIGVRSAMRFGWGRHPKGSRSAHPPDPPHPHP